MNFVDPLMNFRSEMRSVYISCASGANAFTDLLVLPHGDLVRLVGHAQMDLTPADAARLGQVLLALARAVGWQGSDDAPDS